MLLVHIIKQSQVDYIAEFLCSNILSLKENLSHICMVGIRQLLKELPEISQTMSRFICKRTISKLIKAIGKVS